MRVAPSAKLVIQRAMLLVGADREVFLAAVMDPPALSEKLVAALKRHRTVTG